MVKIESEITNLIAQSDGEWGIVIEDLNANNRFAFNDKVPFPAESTIKVAIMASVFVQADKNNMDLSHQLLPLRKENIVGGSGVLQHLTPGIKLSLYDLITLMIIQSDNTATNMLIDVVGVEAIQQTLLDLGMNQSHFYRKMMTYPANGNQENLITPYDAFTMLRAITKGSFYSRHVCQQMIYIMKKQQICNGLPSLLPSNEPNLLGSIPDWSFAGKSGWDIGRQHDIGILYVGNRTSILSVYSKGVDAQFALNILGKIGQLVYKNMKRNQEEI